MYLLTFVKHVSNISRHSLISIARYRSLYLKRYIRCVSTQTATTNPVESRLISILDTTKCVTLQNSGISLALDGLSVSNQNYILEGISNLLYNNGNSVINYSGAPLDLKYLLDKISKHQLDVITNKLDNIDKNDLTGILVSSFKITRMLSTCYSDELLYNLLSLRLQFYQRKDFFTKNLFVRALTDHLSLGNYMFSKKGTSNIDLYNVVTSKIKPYLPIIFEQNFIETDDLITILKLSLGLTDHVKSLANSINKISVLKLSKTNNFNKRQMGEILEMVISRRFICSTRFISLFINNMNETTLENLSISQLLTFVNYISNTYTNCSPSARVFNYIDIALNKLIAEDSTKDADCSVGIFYFFARHSYTQSESFKHLISDWIKLGFPTAPHFAKYIERMIWITLKMEYKNPEVIAKMFEISLENLENFTIIDVVKHLFTLSKYTKRAVTDENTSNIISLLSKYITNLKEIGFERLGEMENIQCISNYVFAVASTTNDLSLEQYKLIGDRILGLIDKDADGLKGEAMTQILWAFHKNNILHYTMISTLSGHFSKTFKEMSLGQISLSSQVLSTFSLLDNKITYPLLEHVNKIGKSLRRANKLHIHEFSKILSIIWSTIVQSGNSSRTLLSGLSAGSSDVVGEEEKGGCCSHFGERAIIYDILKGYNWRNFIRDSTASTKRQLLQIITDADMDASEDERISNCIDRVVMSNIVNLAHDLVDESISSISQYKVRRALNSLNISFIAESVISTGLLADFELKDRKIILEIDGPCHFNFLCDGDKNDNDIIHGNTVYRPNGKTLHRNRLFNKLGYRVVSIPWFMCHRQGLSNYIKDKLDSCQG